MKQNNAICAGGLGFDSRAGQIGHSVANGSPPLRRFFGAVLPRRYAEEIWDPPFVTCFGVIEDLSILCGL